MDDDEVICVLDGASAYLGDFLQRIPHRGNGRAAPAVEVGMQRALAGPTVFYSVPLRVTISTRP